MEEPAGSSRTNRTAPGSQSVKKSRQSTVERLCRELTGDRFEDWYRERRYAKNIREGTPYFNQPASIRPPPRHSPSSLLQCHRKIAYRQLNAPEETADPEGIFWIGSQFEEEVALPFLRSAVAGVDEYVTNSVWVDFTVRTDAGELRVKGETDPVVVGSDAEPLLVTEIKTKDSFGELDSPNPHHRAQVHAYMKGLSEKYERTVSKAVILYGSRRTLNVRTFEVKFDPWFWRDTVVGWAAEHTTYRVNGDLPPASPEYGWECKFCSYRERCGKGETGFSDVGVSGFLPGVTSYPREKVVEYLQAHDGERLTPSLAREYPDLVSEHGVIDWYCPACSSEFDWDGIEFQPGEFSRPFCPGCAESDNLAELTVPAAEEGTSAVKEDQQEGDQDG